MKQNKTEILNKENQELKFKLKQANDEIELLKNMLMIKENFISEQKLKLYELMAICEKKNEELYIAIKASHNAKINYINGLKIIKKLNKDKIKKLRDSKKMV